MNEENFSMIEELYKDQEEMKGQRNLKIIPKPYLQEDTELFCKRNNIDTYEKYIDNLSRRINNWCTRVNMYYSYLAIQKIIQEQEEQIINNTNINYFKELKSKNTQDIIDILKDKNETSNLLSNCDLFVSGYAREGIEQLKNYYSLNNEYYDEESLQKIFEDMTQKDLSENNILSPLIKDNINLVFEGSDLIRELSDILKDNVKFYENSYAEKGI